MHAIRPLSRLAIAATAAAIAACAQAPSPPAEPPAPRASTAQLPPETQEFFDAANLVTTMVTEWSGKIHAAQDATRRPAAQKPPRVLKNSVIIITGGAASGAALGAALSRNTKGALIGAMAGGLAGFLYDRVTFREPVATSLEN
jgi:hypothetical protein